MKLKPFLFFLFFVFFTWWNQGGLFSFRSIWSASSAETIVYREKQKQTEKCVILFLYEESLIASGVWCWWVAAAPLGKRGVAEQIETDRGGRRPTFPHRWKLLLAQQIQFYLLYNCMKYCGHLWIYLSIPDSCQLLYSVGDDLSSYLDNVQWFVLIFTVDFHYDWFLTTVANQQHIQCGLH